MQRFFKGRGSLRPERPDVKGYSEVFEMIARACNLWNLSGTQIRITRPELKDLNYKIRIARSELVGKFKAHGQVG